MIEIPKIVDLQNSDGYSLPQATARLLRDSRSQTPNPEYFEKLCNSHLASFFPN
jgi:hypothetical protein